MNILYLEQQGQVKYKIIDIDGSELDIQDLLEKYFFSKEILPYLLLRYLTKSHNDTIG
jgi:hypothetical protein